MEEIAHELTHATPTADFQHLDFIWGEEAKELVYEKIIKQLKA